MTTSVHAQPAVSTPLAATTLPDWLPEVVIFAVAIVVRCWRLGYHSIWFDEAVSLRWASAKASFILEKTLTLAEDKHPPAYYLYLHYWRNLLELFGLGRNDIALRASGALLGVLGVIGLYLLARRLSGRGVARWAALFTALSPLLVWYSQELRMFQPASCLLTWGGYFLARAWSDGGRRSGGGWRRLGWWLAMAAALILALYAYLFSALAMPAAGLSLLVLWHSSRGEAGRSRRLVEGILAFTLVAAIAAPLFLSAWRVNGAESTPGQIFGDFGPTIAHLVRVFTVWRPGWPGWLETLAIVLFGLLAAIGLVAPRRTARGPDRAWLALWIGVPLLLGFLLLASNDAVFAEDRYFLFVGPFVLWSAARGVLVLIDLLPALGWGAGAASVAALALALPALWTPALARENWRAAVELITQQTTANPALRAALITHVDYTRLPVEWYLRQKLSDDELPVFYPFGGALSGEDYESKVAPPLEGLAKEGYASIWLLQSHLDGVDDERLVERWLSSHYPLITEAYPAGIKLTGYAQQSHFAELPDLPASAARPESEMVPGLVLAACEMTTPGIAAADEMLHPPSGWAHVRLWWRATSPISGDYRARVRVVNDAGVWGESLDRDGDLMRKIPTSTWPTDGVMRHELDVNMNPVAPPGDYALTVRLLDGSGTEVGSETPCGSVRVR